MRWLYLLGAVLLAMAACGDDISAEDESGPGSGASSGTTSSATSTVGNGGSSSASSGGGGSVESCADRLICDDFEAYTVGMPPDAPWESIESGGNPGEVAVDDARAVSGTRSVRVATDGTNGFTQALIAISGAPTFPLRDNVMYGRMMFYMEQAANDGVHWTHIEGRGPLRGEGDVTAMYRYGGQHEGRLMANFETSGLSTDCWQHSATALPTNVWSCMEWRFDGPGNRMQYWIDGVELTDLDVMGMGEGCIGDDLDGQWPAPTFDEIRLGWESYQNDAPREAWIDDVIIDDDPIGCP
jgi:hypothetical protein